MEKIKIGDKDWLVGLEWEILPGDSTIKQESKEVAQKTALQFGIVVEYDSTYAIGLSKKNPPKGIKPAAVFLAAANQIYRETNELLDYPDWIVIEEAYDDRYWMSVIKSGIPAPQYDAIISITEVKERITELLINDTYSVFSSSVEIISIFDGIKDIQQKSLNEITEDINIKYSFDKLTGIPTSFVVAGSVSLLVIGLLWGVFTTIDGINSEEKAANLKKTIQQEEIRKRIQYETDMLRYEQESKRSKESKLNEIILGLSGNPSVILSSFYENVGSTEVGTHGWILTEIECYFRPNSNKNEVPVALCDYIYKRTPLSTTRMFLEDYPNAFINGDVGKVQKVVSIDPKFISKAPESILTTIRPSKEWGFNVLSQLQLLMTADITNKINSSTEITYQVPPEPLSPEKQKAGAQPNQPKNINIGIATGTLEVSGKNFDLVKDLAENVDFTSTSLSKINYKVLNGNNLSWVATFNYYVSTLDGDGVGASNMDAPSQKEEEKKQK